MTKSPAIVILSDAAKPMARRIAEVLGGEVHGLARRVTDGVDVGFDDAVAHLSELFLQGRPVIGLDGVRCADPAACAASYGQDERTTGDRCGRGRFGDCAAVGRPSWSQ
jgi:hypothetical protein